LLRLWITLHGHVDCSSGRAAQLSHAALRILRARASITIDANVSRPFASALKPSAPCRDCGRRECFLDVGFRRNDGSKYQMNAEIRPIETSPQDMTNAIRFLAADGSVGRGLGDPGRQTEYALLQDRDRQAQPEQVGWPRRALCAARR
jgi:hypothetical protein